MFHPPEYFTELKKNPLISPNIKTQVNKVTFRMSPLAEGPKLTFWTSCKDYIHEAIAGSLHNKNCGSYGPHCGKLILDKFYLALQVPGGEDALSRMIAYLQEIDIAFAFEPTELCYGGLAKHDGIYGKAQSNDVWVIIADKRWMTASPLVSFYLMAARSGRFYDGSGWEIFMQHGDWRKKSASDWTYCHEGKYRMFWHRLMRNSPEEVFGTDLKKNYPLNIGHGTGFLWMNTNDYTKKFPHWRPKKEL